MITHPEPWPSAPDPLGEALRFCELRGAFYCRAEFTASFGLELPPFEGYPWFHVITGGSCWLESPEAQPRRLAASEPALVPHGEGHWLRSEPEAPTPSIFELATRSASAIKRCHGRPAAAAKIEDHPRPDSSLSCRGTPTSRCGIEADAEAATHVDARSRRTTARRLA